MSAPKDTRRDDELTAKELRARYGIPENTKKVGEATAHPKVTNEPESVMPFVIVVSAVLLALITFLVKYGLGGSLKDEL